MKKNKKFDSLNRQDCKYEFDSTCKIIAKYLDKDVDDKCVKLAAVVVSPSSFYGSLADDLLDMSEIFDED